MSQPNPQTTPNWDAWNAASKLSPTSPVCDRPIEIMIVGKRCIYINDHRVQGGKPYVSENLPYESRTTTVRDVLEAFSLDEILAYVREKIAVDAYYAGCRNYRDAALPTPEKKHA